MHRSRQEAYSFYCKEWDFFFPLIEVKGGIISCVMLREQIQLIKKKREREREGSREKRL